MNYLLSKFGDEQGMIYNGIKPYDILYSTFCCCTFIAPVPTQAARGRPH